jgi:predicted dehydrogenase
VAAGVRVVGIDTVEERCRLGEAGGAVSCASPDDEGAAYIEQVIRTATGGLGADHVFLAAGGDTNGPVELAARLVRDRARVVDIGKTRLDLPWNAYYEKELDVRFSRSYGPGRYDDRYELDGVDYPAGYVRWTERRNLGCFLDLLSGGSVDVGTLVSATRPIEDAATVYEDLRNGSLRGVGFLFEYPREEAAEGTGREPARRSGRAVPTLARRPGRGAAPTVRLGFVGAGSYASSMLLPHLAKHPGATLSRVATTRSLSAVNAQRKFDFESITTDADEVLADPAIDAVFVVTRHHSHAHFVSRALEQGKAVFVEKPLALTRAEVDGILDVVERTGNDRVMVGFNRRFAPLLLGMRRRFGSAGAPVTARYLVNAGRMSAGSWYLDEQLEGSRFLGEGGHFVDTVGWWIGHDPVEVSATATPEGGGLQATLRYPDGSLATITYCTDGDPRVPKETFDVSGGGRNARLDNFARATVWAGGARDTRRSYTGQDKGQRAQLEAFVDAVRLGAAMPIGLPSLVATTRATIAVGESLVSGRPEVP